MAHADVSPGAADVWTYKVLMGVLAFAVVFLGGRFGGHYLHDEEARTRWIQDREPGPDASRRVAVEISKGWKKTKTFNEIHTTWLSADEDGAAFDKPHPVERYAPFAAVAAAVLAVLGSDESARVWARKRAAQRR